MEKQINIGINQIKELEFSIIPKKEIKEDSIKINLSVNTQFNKEEDLFEILITVDLLNNEDNLNLVHIKVSNIFKVENILQFENEEKTHLNIPDGGLVTMLSLSISHARALLAKNTSGSVYENFYIPIVNPTEIAKQVFKK